MKFALGIAMGFVVGMLIAPRSGEETREMLLDKAGDLAKAPQREVENRLREIAKESERKAGEIGSEVGRKTAEAAVRTVTQEVLGDKATDHKAS